MLTDFLKRCKYDLLLLALWMLNVLNLNMFLSSALIFSLITMFDSYRERE